MAIYLNSAVRDFCKHWPWRLNKICIFNTAVGIVASAEYTHNSVSTSYLDNDDIHLQFALQLFFWPNVIQIAINWIISETSHLGLTSPQH